MSLAYDAYSLVEKGDIEALKKIISLSPGIDFDTQDPYKVMNDQNALMLACQLGYLEFVDLLLQAGSNPQARDYIGSTPLRYAVLYHQEDIILKLMKAGGDIHASDEDGVTLLMDSIGLRTPKIYYFLLSEGINIHALDDNSMNALMYAAKLSAKEPLQDLICRGADLYLSDHDGMTALHYAVANGFVNGVEQLIEAGSDLQAKNDCGFTPLMIAASNDDSVCFQKLLQAGSFIGNEMDALNLYEYTKKINSLSCSEIVLEMISNQQKNNLSEEIRLMPISKKQPRI